MGWLDGWLDGWIPEKHQRSPVQRWRSRLLVQLLLLAFLASLVLAGAFGATGHWPALIGTLAAMAALISAGLVLKRRGDSERAVSVGLALVFGAICAIGISEPQLDGAAVAWIGIVPLVGVVLQGPRSLALWGPLAVAAMLGTCALRPELVAPAGGVAVPLVARAFVFVAVSGAVAHAFSRFQAELLTELQGVSASNSRFIASVSHELRTPLNAVLGMGQLLRDELVDPKERERLGAVGRSGEAIAALLDGLLDVARIDERPPSRGEPDFDLHGLVAGVGALYEAFARAVGLTLDVSLVGPVPRRVSSCSSALLRQALGELLAHHLSTAKAGGVRLVVTALQAPEARCPVRFSVTTVAPPQGPEREAHSRSEAPPEGAARTEAEGRRGELQEAQGSPRPRQLVERLGSSLSLDLREEGGVRSSFELDLEPAPPVDLVTTAAGAPQAAPSPRPPGRVADPPALPSRRGRILVVDDNPINLRIACAMLRSGGYEVESASNGEAAVEAAQREAPGLVLMDRHMPVMDGLEATRRLRQLPPPLGSVPIVALTAAALPEELVACIDAGMNATLTKPVKVEQLCAVVERYLGPARPKEPQMPSLTTSPPL